MQNFIIRWRALSARALAPVVALLFLACSAPVGGPGGKTTSPIGIGGSEESSPGAVEGGVPGSAPGGGSDPAGGGGGETGGGGGSVAGPGSGGMSGPQASIPAPSLKKTLVANTDSNGVAPTVGYGAIEDPAFRTPQYQVLVSEVPMTPEEEISLFPWSGQGEPHGTMALLARIFSPFGKGGLRGILKWSHSLLPFAFAQTDAPLPEGFDPSICDRVGVLACCPITSDGSFECYPRSANGQELYVYTTDGRRLSEPQVMKTIDTVFYAGLPVKDVAADPASGDGASIHILTDGIGTKITSQMGEVAIQGDYRADYATIPATNAGQMAYDGTKISFAKPEFVESIQREVLIELNDLVPDAIVGLFGDIEANPDAEVAPEQTRTTMDATDYENDQFIIPNTNKYRVKKPTNGENHVVREPKSTNLPLRERIWHPSDPARHLEFLSPGELGAGIQVRDTITFDIDTNGYGLVVFQVVEPDPDNPDQQITNFRLRLVNNGPPDRKVFGGSERYTGSYQFADLQVYHGNSGRPDTDLNNEGKALLLDKNGNKLWQVKFNYQGPPSVGKYITMNEAESFSLGTDKDSKAFVLHGNKAYVANGDDTLTEVTLKN
ncbi:MAG: hypothetical protein Q7T11_00585, partial [Deltaproteobacteria bacterium]|nr:hypothetical protein [Deltaproteobacteria bacterium]